MSSEQILASDSRGPTSDQRLGELLLDRQLLAAGDLERALALQPRVRGRLGSVLVRTGALSEDNLLDVLSEQLGLPLAERDLPLPGEDEVRSLMAATPVGLDWLLDRQAVLWESADGQLHCASRDPLAPGLEEALRFLLPARVVEHCLVRSQDLDRLLDRLGHLHAASADNDSGDVRQLRELAEEAPTVELVNNLMAQAVEQRASDIHIEPEERLFAVRFRIDGVLQSRLSLPRDRFNAVASRLKLISGMDIAERRLPQDGRLSARVSGQDMDIRVSALPGVHGESIVMRLLPKERRELGLEMLGFAADHLAMVQSWMQEANGIVLVTGPTGSGKSTTLYSALAASNDGLKKIITVEDPVEFQLPAVTQIQTHSEIGLTFAKALRSILRQDPDVIMIGEIRDLETAEIAVQAALTGHLVLSTLHTNDAVSAFTRLVDMGLEPFLVATPMKGVQAQRLVRRLCPQCTRPAAAPAAELLAMVAPWAQRLLPGSAPQWREAVGCAYCQGTGYRGRFGIYELIDVSPEMQQLISSGANAQQLRDYARAAGARFLREDGLVKAWQGQTSVDEVLRVTSG